MSISLEISYPTLPSSPVQPARDRTGAREHMDLIAMGCSVAPVSATGTVSSVSFFEDNGILLSLGPYLGDTACPCDSFLPTTEEPGQSSFDTPTLHSSCPFSMKPIRPPTLSASSSIFSPISACPCLEQTEQEAERQETPVKERKLAMAGTKAEVSFASGIATERWLTLRSAERNRIEQHNKRIDDVKRLISKLWKLS